MRRSLKRPRTIAYNRQAGRCFYCGVLMWTDNHSEFASKYGLSLAQTRGLQCTGEHLQAFADGGGSAQSNIVAACWHCNHQRHHRKNPPTPERYKTLVERRVARGRWHDPVILKRLLH